jgi:hypothetical protein
MPKNIETWVMIEATSTKVGTVLFQLEKFHLWNSRTHFSDSAILGESQPMQVKLFGLWIKVPVRIESLSMDEGLSWVGGIPGVFTGKHYFRAQARDDGSVQFIQGEDFNGLLVPILLPIIKNELNRLYAGMNAEIKTYCEDLN